MNLYLISQNENNGYDTFDTAVVCCEDEISAKMIHPSGKSNWDGKGETWDAWSAADKVTAKLIGKATEGVGRGVVIASFNAG
jgi:hypothetical protein